ncbi:Uncharacterised protein [Zhongshania aliphaticivorans]|uniref:Uncharacterized protein n=1 Tax=Zhongshania aliphaticivorans TaxID=1470434 RepID=A0A5S9Q5W4_9GAMM|nr:Uncharacterised protein [Zhongshania aliphaticivorans]CAA0112411.1 Uncharacterised protein [Zhongshania aliphaticivorans]
MPLAQASSNAPADIVVTMTNKIASNFNGRYGLRSTLL